MTKVKEFKDEYLLRLGVSFELGITVFFLKNNVRTHGRLQHRHLWHGKGKEHIDK
jgi:hypothetical protein